MVSETTLKAAWAPYGLITLHFIVLGAYISSAPIIVKVWKWQKSLDCTNSQGCSTPCRSYLYSLFSQVVGLLLRARKYKLVEVTNHCQMLPIIRIFHKSLHIKNISKLSLVDDISFILVAPFSVWRRNIISRKGWGDPNLSYQVKMSTLGNQWQFASFSDN